MPATVTLQTKPFLSPLGGLLLQINLEDNYLNGFISYHPKWGFLP